MVVVVVVAFVVFVVVVAAFVVFVVVVVVVFVVGGFCVDSDGATSTKNWFKVGGPMGNINFIRTQNITIITIITAIE